MSREHAAIVRRWDGVVVQDLGSKNGVSVNHEPDSELRVRDGDLVRIPTSHLAAVRFRPTATCARSRRKSGTPPPPRRARPVSVPRTAPRPAAARRASVALRAAIAVATGVLLMVAAAVLMLALGR